jgi:SAM-dependent methyltransferase
MDGVNSFYEDFTSYLVRDRVIPNPRHRAIQGLADPIIRAGRKGSALDVGCGIGIMSQFLRRHFDKVVALDISETNIAFARQTVPNVDFVVSDFLGFETREKFDVFAFFDVLEHFPEKELAQVAGRVANHAHAESVVLITIPSAAFARSDVVPKQVIDEAVEVLTLARLFDAEGFELRECRSYGVVFDDQYRLLSLSRRPPGWRPERSREPLERRISRLARVPLNMLRYRKALAAYPNVIRRRGS